MLNPIAGGGGERGKGKVRGRGEGYERFLNQNLFRIVVKNNSE